MKGKALPTSPFGCRMLVRQHQGESDLTPDISCVGYIECTGDACHYVANFRRENVAIAQRDVPMGACGCRTPQCFQICKKVGQKSAMLQEKVSQHITDCAK